MAWAEPVSKKGPRAEWRWRGRYRVHGQEYTLRKPDGSPWIFTQEAEAKRQATKKELEMRQPGAVLPGAGRITWGEWADEWWPKHKKTIEANSIATYESKLRIHIRPRWESEPLDSIEQGAVQEWVSGLPLGATTAGQVYGLFATSMKAAVKGKKITGSPCVDITLPVPPPPAVHFLTRAEFDKIVPFLEGVWRMLVLVIVGTGMRWGEAVALHWQDVHVELGTIGITQAYSVHGGYIKAYPKNKKARTVPLPPWLADALKAWQPAEMGSKCNARHKVAGRCRSPLVLPGPTGGCWTYPPCARRFGAAVELAGIRHATLHDLRDTYASWLLQAGIELDQVAELLDHADTRLTRERYAEYGTSQFDRVAAALEAPAAVAAPILPQPQEGKIIRVDFRRRTGA